VCSGSSVEHLLLRNVGGETATDKDIFEIHLNTFCVVSTELKSTKKITLRISFPLQEISHKCLSLCSLLYAFCLL
jgi:hypothetical protein